MKIKGEKAFLAGVICGIFNAKERKGGNAKGAEVNQHFFAFSVFPPLYSSALKFFSITENEISGKIIGLALQVHTVLGPGLLESVYKECLYYKVYKSGLYVEKEKTMPVIYEEVKLECGYRIDLLIENQLLIEVKSAEAISDVYLAQTLTYLRLGNFKLGLLINFNVLRLKEGIRRVANGL